MDDGRTVPIVHKSLQRASQSRPFPPSQNAGLSGRSSPNIRVSRRVELPPKSQTWVTVTAQCQGRILIQPLPHTYELNVITAANLVSQVQLDQPFRLFTSNFINHPVKRHKNKMMAVAVQHPTLTIPTNISRAKFLAIHLPDEIPPPDRIISDKVPVPKKEGISQTCCRQLTNKACHTYQRSTRTGCAV